MSEPGFPVETVEALAIAGIERKQWENLLQRRLYDAAPPTIPGRARAFAVDDVVCLVVLDRLLRGGMAPPMAGRVASAVRKELAKRHENLERLWIASTRSGVPRRVVSRKPPAGILQQEIMVGYARRRVLELAAELAAKRRP